MANCRKCGRSFNWDAGEGYARLPDGTYLCGVSCELKELHKENSELRGMVNVLADKLARYTGTNVPHEVEKAKSVAERPRQEEHDWCADSACEVCNRRHVEGLL